MFFKPSDTVPTVRVSRQDVEDPLSPSSRFGFHLDDADWPSVEHYYQGMKFIDPAIREAIRTAPDPEAARALGKQHKRALRGDWKKVRITVMTRGVYIKARSHEAVAQVLRATGDQRIVETSQYDYFWGIGRDGRGDNEYGKVLMAVREKLSQPDA
ncbi:MAG: NADAR family protein [Gammaproteobacteria bacterium]|nr:NADAR family protein [Gammaproteobacteria bacterium]MCP5137387.1 NADAR family protein [Gammaproteobacteria bacterium]